MKKILIVLSILIIFGLLIGGTVLFSGVTSVDENTSDFNEIFGSVSADDCDPAPGYPNNCNPL